MNLIELRYQNQLTIKNNLTTLSQFALNGPCSFQIVKEKNENGPTQYMIKRSNFINEIFQHIFYNKQTHLKNLEEILKSNISILEKTDSSWFLGSDQTYTDLFLAAQKYNQTVAACWSSKSGLFAEWNDILVRHRSHRGLIPLRINRIAQTPMQHIPNTQKAYVHQEGWFWKHNVYHYNEEDASIDHGLEAARIFLSTQSERVLSAIGKAMEWIARLFGQEITLFHRYHYFRDNEDVSPERIYRNDSPIANFDTPTFYWIGHATNLMNIPLTSSSGRKVAVNLITDPVESDLHQILYPRMTKPARLIEACPAVHVFLLSHNHLDHYDESTIKKLLTQQPVMIVPKGDAQKLKCLGFKNVYENDWWQSTTIEIEQAGDTAQLKITGVPARHWSGQGICDSHRSAFLGYVIHGDGFAGDIYFAGDTARLSESHLQTLKERFHIQALFQPGGPDEIRKDMESSHQASVDGLWMHMKLMVQRLYETAGSHLTKEQFIEQTKQLRTFFMHTKAFKLGNLHFDDTEQSIQLVLSALCANPQQLSALLASMKNYERQVYHELCQIGREMTFSGQSLAPEDIYRILKESVTIPLIGQRCLLAKNHPVSLNSSNRILTANSGLRTQ